MRIGDLLLEAQLVTVEQIDHAIAHSDGLRLGSALVANRAVEPDAVARALAQQLGVPPVKSADLINLDPAARAAVPDALQKRLYALPYRLHGSGAHRVVEVAMRDPENQGAINELGLACGMKIDARIAPEILLREALYPRSELPPASAFEHPSAGAASDDGGLELDLDRVKRPTDGTGASHGRRGNAYMSSRTNRPTGNPPAAAGAPGAPAPAGAAPPLPPLQYETATPGRAVGQVFKLVFALAAIAFVVFVGLRFKKCMTSTTKSVGTHYDSKLLGLGIDFPDEAGWRVAPDLKVQLGSARSEYFYRGGVPEVPVVTMVLARGPADQLATAAQAALTDLVADAQMVGCEPSPDRAGALVCRGGGSLTLFGKKRQNVAIDVHAWVISTGELVMAVMINPDHTLSETQYILSSIVEQ
jgi:hypothetical protein